MKTNIKDRRKADLFVFQDYDDLSINLYDFCVSDSMEDTITITITFAITELLT